MYCIALYMITCINHIEYYILRHILYHLSPTCTNTHTRFDVTRQVRMTKCLYAQLMQQQFTPDRRSGYTLPPVDDPTFKSHDLGSKLVSQSQVLCATTVPQFCVANGGGAR